MNATLISIETDVLIRLLKLREHRLETYNDVLRRVLPRVRKAGSEKVLPHAVNPISTVRAASPTGTRIQYECFCEALHASDYGEATIDILARIGRNRPAYFERLAVAVRGRSRNHLARTPQGVYPERPDLISQVKELVPGWFLGCNVSNREKEMFIRKACDLAGLAFGVDIKIEFTDER